MELNAHDKNILTGMKARMGRDRDLIKEMYLKELDLTVKKILGELADSIDDDILTITLITNKIRP